MYQGLLFSSIKIIDVLRVILLQSSLVILRESVPKAEPSELWIVGEDFQIVIYQILMKSHPCTSDFLSPPVTEGYLLDLGVVVYSSSCCFLLTIYRLRYTLRLLAMNPVVLREVRPGSTCLHVIGLLKPVNFLTGAFS